MVFWWHCLLLYFIVFILHNSQNASGNLSKSSFGPYTEDFISVELCQGPKKRNISEGFVRLYRNKNGDYILNGSVTILQNVRNVILNYKIFKFNNGRYEHVMALNRNKVCGHVGEEMARITNIVNVDIKTCTIQKGTKTFEENLTQVHQRIHSGSHFYGRYSLRFRAFNSKYNLVCIRLQNIIRPKP